MTLSTRMKTELPHMKPGAFLWYDCAPDGGHYWLRGMLVRALKGKKPGTYRLKVDWGRGGWIGYGEEPKLLDYLSTDHQRLNLHCKVPFIDQKK